MKIHKNVGPYVLEIELFVFSLLYANLCVFLCAFEPIVTFNRVDELDFVKSKKDKVVWQL